MESPKLLDILSPQQEEFGLTSAHPSSLRAIIELTFQNNLSPQKANEYAPPLAKLIEKVNNTSWFPEERVEYLPLGKLTHDTLARSDLLLEDYSGKFDHVGEIYDSEINVDRHDPISPIKEGYRKGLEWIDEQVELDTRMSGDEENNSRQITAVSDGEWSDPEPDEEYEGEGFRYYDIRFDEIRRVDVSSSIGLFYFAKALRSISDGSGFSDEGLVFYVLTGIRPILPRWKFVQQEQSKATFEIKFYVENITSHDFQLMSKKFNELEEDFHQGKRTSFINMTDTILLEIVRQQGGVPSSDKKGFWKEVFETCQEYGMDSWQYPSSVKKRYGRILDKIDG